jgi:hypothetical protein
VSLDTARRWKRHRRIPPLAARLVSWIADGHLGALDRAWTGFNLRCGRLWTPYDFGVTPGEISAIPYRNARIRALEQELRTPAQWDLFGGSTPLLTHQASEALGGEAMAKAADDAHRELDRSELVDVVSHFATERRRRSPSSARAWWRRR